MRKILILLLVFASLKKIHGQEVIPIDRAFEQFDSLVWVLEEKFDVAAEISGNGEEAFNFLLPILNESIEVADELISATLISIDEKKIQNFRHQSNYEMYKYCTALATYSYQFNFNEGEPFYVKGLEYRERLTEFPFLHTMGGTEGYLDQDDVLFIDGFLFIQLADVRLTQKKYSKAAEYARRALLAPKIDAQSRISASIILASALEAQEIRTAEAIEARIRGHETMSALDPSTIQFWDSLNFVRPIDLYQNIYEGLRKNPSLATGGAYYARSFSVLKREGLYNEALDFAERAMDNGKTDRVFLREVIDFTRSRKEPLVGIKACELLRAQTSESDCPALLELSSWYAEFGVPSKAEELKNKSIACSQNQEGMRIEAAQQEEIDRKKRERIAKRNSGANNGLYFGVDVLPLARISAEKRDFGFQFDLIGRHVAHEFFYAQVGSNRDFMLDLSDVGDYEIRWDGMQAHYAMKFLDETNSRSAMFVGPLFRYREKTFAPVDSDFYDANSVFLGTDTFSATEKQFEALLNYGAMSTHPGFSAQVYFGFGVKYSQFTFEHEYDEDVIFSHPLLEQRKETRFGLAMRMGFTVGIKLF